MGGDRHGCGRHGPPTLAVDYTHPDAALLNAEFYAGKLLPFVMGTTFHTEAEAARLRDIVVSAQPGSDAMARSGGLGMDGGGPATFLRRTHGDDCYNTRMYAVVAPNMGKPIVVMQAMVEAAAAQFPGALAGMRLRTVESHQMGKADTSGTAKAVVSGLAGLGLEGSKAAWGPQTLIDEIEMLRDPVEQARHGVPEEHIPGHAYHRYELVSEDGTVQLALEHNVCGRAVYAEGTVDAVEFLSRVVDRQHERRFWTMLDLLGEGAINSI